MITGNCSAGECPTKTRFGVKSNYRQITETDAQLICRAGFLKERVRKTELGLKIANLR